MERAFSVDDLVGNLWRLGRTPSEANLQTYDYPGTTQGDEGQQPQTVQQQQVSDQSGPGALARVPSLDVFRRIFGNATGGEGGSSGPSISPAQSNWAAPIPMMQMPAVGNSVEPGSRIPRPEPLRTEPADSTVALNQANANTNEEHQNSREAQPATSNQTSEWQGETLNSNDTTEGAESEGGNAGRRASNKKRKRVSSKNGGGRTNPDLTAQVKTVDENGNALSPEEIRRQRRMLSNRESARRSRKRKMEHVHVLENQVHLFPCIFLSALETRSKRESDEFTHFFPLVGFSFGFPAEQVNHLKSEKESLLNRVHELEHRYEVTLRETAAMRAEVDRLHGLLAANGIDHRPLAHFSRGPGPSQDERPNQGSNQDDTASRGNASQRGFVPFRSVKSYENLLSMHQQEKEQQAQPEHPEYDDSGQSPKGCSGGAEGL